VTISGASGSWAALNRTWKITQIDANTFSIPIDSTAFTGPFNGTITTTAPRTSKAIWSIKKFYYSGPNVIREAKAGGVTSENQIWDNINSLSFA
jgi:hypothetical protein